MYALGLSRVIADWLFPSLIALMVEEYLICTYHSRKTILADPSLSRAFQNFRIG